MNYKGYEIELTPDVEPPNPRTEWDNFGTMVCFMNRYDLGDKTDLRPSQFNGWPDLEKHLINIGAAVILPLYLYAHGGITMNTTGFSCRWDSGQVGFIYATREQILKEFGGKRVTKKLREKVADILRYEVEEYDQYLTGDVWSISVTEDGEGVDSCHGLFGYDYALEYAKSNIDHMEKS